MKSLGYFLITASFLAGSYFAVVQPVGLPLTPYLLSLAVGIVGIVLVRTAIRRAATHEDTMAANIDSLSDSLRQIVSRVDDLEARKNEINVYDLRLHIDRELPPLLDSFVQARESLAHRFGLQSYADVMNPFSAGERYINRVWSASTDGYIDEAHDYLAMSREQFDEALTILQRLRGGAA